jgi:hypothetical protein
MNASKQLQSSPFDTRTKEGYWPLFLGKGNLHAWHPNPL